MRFRSPVGFTLLCIVLMSLTSCAVNPATGQRQFSLISEAREIEMGREADTQISAGFGVYDDERLGAWVAEIGMELMTLVAQCDSRRTEPTWRSRSRVVHSAIHYILDNAHEAVTVANVCAATRVSFRTLDRAFREHLRASPKDCITGVRLQGARLEIKRSGSEARVADVANQWGFWHLGDFARVYRREFNELPSETACR